MATPTGGRPDVKELPVASAEVRNHSHDKALAVIEALIDFPPEAGTTASAAWKERIATLLDLSRPEEHVHPHECGLGAPPVLMS